ncbi:sigma-70 family RNA polymerase sigma factor [Nocardioides sp. YIM 152315]|uniref:sigma-70 family RNA polymerase sigma factor n=1 Tax=Nocardioides sp. YIM 152315 TaxID=3031760 RepID=UPI0023DC3972|nr:sigma-70 family RNA polymerase sigma factor [Nocardioides sp. YIM 152315]MDF1605662.1 sigma-70 family RNA polymerase sigma factor [Nocardioides sp. YIM 152315]
METFTAPQAPVDIEVDIEQLVLDHLPLVQHLVHETSRRIPSYFDRTDLQSAGHVALVRAARAWEPERGVPFAAYATTRIRGALVDELRSVDWATRAVRRRGREIEQERSRQSAATGQPVSDVAVAASLGLDAADVARSDADVARAAVGSLQAHDEAVLDSLACTATTPAEQVELGEQMRYLAAAIEELPARLRLVVRGYFLEERPMAELAAELGVTESRISQLRAEALVLLRDVLAQAFEPHLVTPHARPQGVAARRRAAYAQAVVERTRLPRQQLTLAV